MMGALVAILTSLLFVSLLANAHMYHKWHSYRSKPAGVHSHTGMMPAIRVARKEE